MTVSFHAVETLSASREIVSFPAEINGKRIQCAISWEALQDHFDGNGVPPINCFRANRKAIEAKAEHLIQRGRFESDGSVFIRSQDGA